MIKQTEEASRLFMTVKDVQGFMKKDSLTVVGFFESINDKQVSIFKDVGMLH